ncbi:MAG: alpha/beta fold hydrolase [Rikenellaceae bacterium]
MGMREYTYNYPTPFPLESGESLPLLKIIFHSSVDPDSIEEALEQGRRVVWVCHALTANSDPSEWWPDLVGVGKFFDTERDIVICANTIGSCYGTTGPTSWGGKPLDFPLFTVRDIVAAHVELRRHLKIDKIDILIGGSVGGFQSLEWAVMEPKVISHLILIACNERITPWATAFNEAQRMAIEADATFGGQESLEGGVLGLRAARTMALISYRSYDGYNIKQSEEDDDCFCAKRVSSYQRYQGEKLSNRFNAYAYYCMTIMLDTHNVGRNRGGVAKVLSELEPKTLLMAIDSDILFPPSELKSISEHIPASRYAEIPSAFGHDGFLIECDALQREITAFLEQ